MCNTSMASILWHLQNVFSLCSHLTQISGGRKSLYLQECILHVGRCSAVHDVDTGSLLPRAVTWHLPFSAWRLQCFMQDEAYCPSVLTTGECICNKYWFLCTWEKECHHASANCPLPVVSLCMHTDAFVHFCVCFCILYLNTREFMLIYTVFALVLLGQSNLCLCNTFYWLRGPNKSFLYLFLLLMPPLTVKWTCCYAYILSSIWPEVLFFYW